MRSDSVATEVRQCFSVEERARWAQTGPLGQNKCFMSVTSQPIRRRPLQLLGYHGWTAVRTPWAADMLFAAKTSKTHDYSSTS